MPYIRQQSQGQRLGHRRRRCAEHLHRATANENGQVQACLDLTTQHSHKVQGPSSCTPTARRCVYFTAQRSAQSRAEQGRAKQTCTVLRTQNCCTTKANAKAKARHPNSRRWHTRARPHSPWTGSGTNARSQTWHLNEHGTLRGTHQRVDLCNAIRTHTKNATLRHGQHRACRYGVGGRGQG